MARSTVRQLPARQRMRRALLLMSLLLFPVTLYYFSPVLIMESAAEGVVNASFIVFAAMFISSLFLGTALVRLGLSGRRAAGTCRARQQPAGESTSGLDQMGYLVALAGWRHRAGGGRRGLSSGETLLPT